MEYLAIDLDFHEPNIVGFSSTNATLSACIQRLNKLTIETKKIRVEGEANAKVVHRNLDEVDRISERALEISSSVHENDVIRLADITSVLQQKVLANKGFVMNHYDLINSDLSLKCSVGAHEIEKLQIENKRLKKQQDSIMRDIKKLQDSIVELESDISSEELEYERDQTRRMEQEQEVIEKLQNQLDDLILSLKEKQSKEKRIMQELNNEEIRKKELDDGIRSQLEGLNGQISREAEVVAEMEDQLANMGEDVDSMGKGLGPEFWDEELKSLASEVDQLMNDTESSGEFGEESFWSETSEVSSVDGSRDWAAELADAKQKLEALLDETKKVSSQVESIKNERSTTLSKLKAENESLKENIKAKESGAQSLELNIGQHEMKKNAAVEKIARLKLELTTMKSNAKTKKLEEKNRKAEEVAFLEAVKGGVVAPTPQVRRSIRISQETPRSNNMRTPRTRAVQPNVTVPAKKFRNRGHDSDEDLNEVDSEPLSDYAGLEVMSQDMKQRLAVLEKKKQKQVAPPKKSEAPVRKHSRLFEKRDDVSSLLEESQYSSTTNEGTMLGGMFSPLSNRPVSPERDAVPAEANFSMMDHFAVYEKKAKKPKKMNKKKVVTSPESETSMESAKQLTDSGSNPRDRISRRFSSDIFLNADGSSEMPSDTSNVSIALSSDASIDDGAPLFLSDLSDDADNSLINDDGDLDQSEMDL
ncbi:unnamed protein product [Caenorhabditis auriculariae]|uniref:Uncharacterized protein n=1 Tax=Caenorhabditis auriculariae TaxID=2777116 RepID=A0A8S1HDY7_9PELO|nr:unnamed protein product [Caenorhabditis auriculariae]